MLTLAPELGQFPPPTQVSIIDGKRWQKRFWHNSLELEQVKTANLIFISRTEEIDETRRGKIDQSLEKHSLLQERANPSQLAPIIKKLSDDLAAISQRSDLDETKRIRGEYRVVSNHAHYLSHSHHEELHFASFQINLPGRIKKSNLVKFLANFPLASFGPKESSN